jgi:hypothetical protein
MIKRYTFNKRKDRSIVLLHGLYTTSGFWLSYFNLFKDFRIIAFDINYDVLLKTENAKFYIQSHINECSEDENIVAIISHSFGTVISDLAFENKYHCVFKICPVAFSKKIDYQSFILNIESKTSFTSKDICEYMTLVSDFMLKFKQQLNRRGSIFIPSKDGFFSYSFPEVKISEFEGDHFNVGLALSSIMDQLPGSLPLNCTDLNWRD